MTKKESSVDEVDGFEIVYSRIEELKLEGQIVLNQAAVEFVKERVQTLITYHGYLKFYAEALLGTENETTHQLLKKELPFTPTQLLAILIQNKMTPKNSHRTDLIKSGLYNELRSEEEAFDWFRHQIREMFKKLYEEYTKNKEQFDRNILVQKKAKIFAQTTSQEEAAACLYKSYIGSGDFVQFYEALCQGEKIPLAGFKLGLLVNPVFQNVWLLKDKLREDKKDKDFVIKGNLAFNIWKNICCKSGSLTEEELLVLFPEAAQKIFWWKRYIDEKGD